MEDETPAQELPGIDAAFADGVIEMIPSSFPTVYSWDYEVNKANLRALYDRAKLEQWNAQTNDKMPHPDWSLDVPVNDQTFPDARFAISTTEFWGKMTPAQRDEFRLQATSWSLSQFMHGEQGALLATAKIVKSVPSIDAKFYAATQVMDEARHVEVYDRYLREKIEMAYPINQYLKTLLDQVLSDSRWDFTYLGMQIMIEGLALAAFAMIRDYSEEPLSKALNTYVMQDEARHVAFGRLALREFYPHLDQAERDEREEFVVEACYLMRDRFLSEEVFETVGLPVEECVGYVEASEMMRSFRSGLFSRIVPTIKDIGLWGPKVRRAYSNMGILGYADVDTEELARNDEQVAQRFDARRAER